MIRVSRDFRLVPIVLLATIALFALKVSGLIFDGGYTLAERLESSINSGLQNAAHDNVPTNPNVIVADDPRLPQTSETRQPWAREMFNYNDGRDVTGSVGHDDKKTDAKEVKDDVKLKVTDKPPGETKVEAAGVVIPLRPGHVNSAGERAILESLHERHQQLEVRGRELDMRENLLKAAEKRLEAKIDELKNLEARVKSEMGSRDEAEAKRLKGLVTMYSGMKPKEAARIFDRLDMKILTEVSTQISPRTMSAILAQMTPEAAERLTVELANRGGTQPVSQNPNQLPKIEGTPSGR
jgi:flagellar motility protein MotE (MotC chaperone)